MRHVDLDHSMAYSIATILRLLQILPRPVYASSTSFTYRVLLLIVFPLGIRRHRVI